MNGKKWRERKLAVSIYITHETVSCQKWFKKNIYWNIYGKYLRENIFHWCRIYCLHVTYAVRTVPANLLVSDALNLMRKEVLFNEKQWLQSFCIVVLYTVALNICFHSFCSLLVCIVIFIIIFIIIFIMIYLFSFMVWKNLIISKSKKLCGKLNLKKRNKSSSPIFMIKITSLHFISQVVA